MDPRRLESEIERSRLEARSLTDEDLVLTSKNLGKYTNVPATATQPLRYAYHLLGAVKGKVVLDYGCGSGENSVILSALGADVIGIDISPDLVEVAEKRMRTNGLRWDVRAASAYATGAPDASFDAVFGVAILHHLDIEDSAREVHRMLKPGGIAVFCEPLRDLAALRWLRRIVPIEAREASDDEYPLTGDHIRRFCSSFELLTSRRFSSPWGRLLFRLGNEHHEWLDRLDCWFNENVTGALAAIEVFRLRKAP